MHQDHQGYHRFTSRARLEKSVNSLLGLIEGIALDGQVNASEAAFLSDWLGEHRELRDNHPYNELIPVVERAMSDGVLSEEERADITWLCNRLTSTEFFDQVTADLQRLHAVIGGVIADMQITGQELIGLREWLEGHDHLKSCWPYDEIDSLVSMVMRDGRIDEEEHSLLRAYFAEFVAILDGRTIVRAPVQEDGTITGLCASCPDILFEDQAFCFTGASSRYTRDALSDVVSSLGGQFLKTVSKKTNYLVIGAEGNPCWAYACYGRKVERAVELRKEGHRIVIVHEHDFHDAVADHG